MMEIKNPPKLKIWDAVKPSEEENVMNLMKLKTVYLVTSNKKESTSAQDH